MTGDTCLSLVNRLNTLFFLVISRYILCSIDSPSPEEEPRPGTSLQRPTSLPGPASDSASAVATRAKVSSVLDPGVINHIEKEARRLATDVDALVENLSCVLQVSITTMVK